MFYSCLQWNLNFEFCLKKYFQKWLLFILYWRGSIRNLAFGINRGWTGPKRKLWQKKCPVPLILQMSCYCSHSYCYKSGHTSSVWPGPVIPSTPTRLGNYQIIKSAGLYGYCYPNGMWCIQAWISLSPFSIDSAVPCLNFKWLLGVKKNMCVQSGAHKSVWLRLCNSRAQTCPKES